MDTLIMLAKAYFIIGAAICLLVAIIHLLFKEKNMSLTDWLAQSLLMLPVMVILWPLVVREAFKDYKDGQYP